jgi:ubiquinone/menaquinone biosynthesis C-methylase UbiE
MKKIIKSLSEEHYDFLKYVKKNRFMSYYYQLTYIYNINPKSILEIGPGNNFLKNSLKENFDIKTLDINKEFKPDFKGSIDDIPLKDKLFDLVCCFQVLEHLPFNKFEKSLLELSRISKKYVLISLPFSRFDFKLSIKIPLLPEFKFCYSIPKFYKKHNFDGQHYWEIGKKSYPKKRIIKIIQNYFIIEEIKNPYEDPYHIFFKLRKKE